MTGIYVTGWIKRGPVGLIGHTKGDANETVDCLLDRHGRGQAPGPAEPGEDAIIAYLDDKNVAFTTWDGWYRLDAHERALGAAEGRERVKVVERDEMFAASEPHKVNKS